MACARKVASELTQMACCAVMGNQSLHTIQGALENSKVDGERNGKASANPNTRLLTTGLGSPRERLETIQGSGPPPTKVMEGEGTEGVESISDRNNRLRGIVKSKNAATEESLANDRRLAIP